VFVLTRHRVITGLLALAAGLWVLADTTTAQPPLPKDAIKPTAQTDIDFLQKKLADINANPKMNKGAMKTVKGVALMLALYGDASGDMALRDQALAVAEEIAKKNWKGAETAARGLSSPKATGGKAVNLLDPKLNFSLEEGMSPLRVTKAGGMGIENDLKGAIKEGKIDPKDALTIGTHSAAISAFAEKLPNEKAMANPAKTKLWNQLSKDMADTGKQLAEEAGKGTRADQKALMTSLKKLEKSCVQCHAEFRDD